MARRARPARMILGVLALAAHAQVADVGFTAEHVALALSPAVVRDAGLVLELQAQALPDLVSPTGFEVIPLVPRLGVGWSAHAGEVGWSVGAHSFGIISADGMDRGGGGGLSAGALLATPRGRLRSGLEADATYFTFRSVDDRHRQVSAGLDLSTGYDVRPDTTVLFRFGSTVGSLRSDTPLRGVRVDHTFQPRFSVGLAIRPTPRLTAALAGRMGIRQLIPRVPWSLVASVGVRLGGP